MFEAMLEVFISALKDVIGDAVATNKYLTFPRALAVGSAVGL